MSQITIIIYCQEDLNRRELNNIVANSHEHLHRWLLHTKQNETLMELNMGVRKCSVAIEIK